MTNLQTPDDLLPLIEALINDTIDDANFARLEDALRNSPDARQTYRRYINLHTALPTLLAESPRLTPGLSLQLPGSPDAHSIQDDQKMSSADLLRALVQAEQMSEAQLVRLDDPAKKPAKRRLSIDDADAMTPREIASLGGYLIKKALFTPAGLTSAIAAALLLGVAIFFALSSNDNPTPPTDFATPPNNKPAESAQPIPRDTVATLTATHNAVWGNTPAERALARGSQLRTGDRLTLTAGFAQITTARGAVAIIEAPATIQLTDSNNAIELHSGKLVGICETDTSKGFLVRTPHLDITDLGTRFGVDVSDAAATEVHVFEGVIQLQHRTAGDAASPQNLIAGQSARATALRSAIQRIDHDPAGFAGLMDHRSRLYGTGVGLTVGEADPNWVVMTEGDQTLASPGRMVVLEGGFFSRLQPNDPKRSQWLSYVPSQMPSVQRPAVEHRIQTTINLPADFDLDTTHLLLSLIVDNALDAVIVNGQRIETDLTMRNDQQGFDRVRIDRHLRPGTNTITLVALNTFTPGFEESNLLCLNARLDLIAANEAKPQEDRQ